MIEGRFMKYWVLLFLLVCSQSLWACPPPEELSQNIKNLFPRLQNFKIDSVNPLPMGWCEVVLKFKQGKRILYVDQKGEYAFVGQLFSFKGRENLTLTRLKDLNRLSPAQLKRLDELVAFEVGNGPKSLFLVTDPDCPYCKKMEKILSSLIKEGKVRVKVLLYPLEKLHPEARAKSVAIICDKKAWEGLLKGYKSGNLCAEGEKKISLTQAYLRSLGIYGTPTLILPNGQIINGAKNEEQLRKLLGIDGS